MFAIRWIRHAEFKIIFTIIIIISIHDFFYHHPCSTSTVIQPLTQAFVQLQSNHPDITSIDNASSQGSEQEDRNRRLKSELSSSSSLSAAVSHDYDHQLLRYIDIVYATDLADTQLHYLVRSINSIVQTTMTSIGGGDNSSSETTNETSRGGDNSSSETTTIYSRDVFSLRIHVFYEAAKLGKVSSSGSSHSWDDDDNYCDMYDDCRRVYERYIG